jgi:hypothetical protein
VARLYETGLGRNLGRAFMRGQKDYSEANSVGSRGVYLTFLLPPDSLYEVRSFLAWKNERRYFIRTTDTGEIEEVTEAQVRAWLSAGLYQDWVEQYADTIASEATYGDRKTRTRD